jgi:hypothetical protein
MANRHAKLNAIDLEKLTSVAGHIELIFAWSKLILGLASLNLSTGIDDKGSNLPTCFREPFHAEDSRHVIRSRPLRHSLQHSFLLPLIKGQHIKILTSQTGEVGFRETGDLRALRRSLGYEPLDFV